MLELLVLGETLLRLVGGLCQQTFHFGNLVFHFCDIRTKIKDILGAFMFGGEASEKKVRFLAKWYVWLLVRS